ncbi:hypothetical protein DCAR_0414589 [Daucus carota subsp. sativus]|uniref:Ubiquitin-like protease family profile domain-containing protein n=1 Tax=Daucus carota subsp. sativus TaxID=79200 RepID=A0AAF0WT34_DAUCS|nr:hypothetical protein DCAR_0414589 [Daucus carota subsp. sativus]
MLVLQSGKIKIIDHLVHEILGLPCRGHEVKLAQGDSRYDRLLEWREQFSVSEGQSLIKASDVVEKMRQSGAVDDLFKINFLVVMANVLIRSNTNNFVAQSIISFDDDLDNCAKYNWASYLIRSLVITKQRWKRTSSLFYTGPMIFLLLETRKEQMEPEKKTKRDIKVGPAYRSPYVQRNTNIFSHYSRQEIAVYRENIFVCKEQKFLRKVIRTLRPGKKLSYSVIDIWSILMNDRENYKSPDSPMRLYFDIGFSIGPLDEKNSEEAQYQMFKSEMEHFFNRYPNIRFEGSDLLFFPVYANRHFYLVCFNLMKQAFEVIDNIRQGKNAGKYYGPRIRLLVRFFLLANLVKNLKPSYLVMPWQTIQNDTDCGLFLMRHMETYMGDAKTWTSDLKPENYGQTRQLDKIRAKYCHAILASPLNEIRQKILDEAKLLYNKMASERVMSIVIEASKRKGARVHGKKMIKGRVLFDED